MLSKHYPDALIVVVNDDLQTLYLLRELLGLEGYCNIRTISDPREGLEVCLAEKPDLLMLDLRMPYMDGYEFMTALKERGGKEQFLPILILTADVDSRTKQRALQMGASEFLTEPFDATEAMLRVRHLIALRFFNLSLAEQVRARTQQVETTQAAFQQLFEANPLPMWIYDRDNLRFLAVNVAAVHHYGYSQEEFLQLKITDIRVPAQVPELLSQLKRLKHNVEHGTGLQTQHLLKAGRVIDVHVRFQTVDFQDRPAVFVTVEDITARLAAQRALEDSEQRYRLLSENSPNLIRRFLPDGRCVFASSASQTLLGYAPEELLSLNMLDSIHPDDIETLRDAAVRAFRGEQQGTPFERQAYRMKTRDGHDLWVETTLRGVSDPSTGQLLEYQTSTVDISARKAAEIQVQEQLRRYRNLVDLTVALERSLDPMDVAMEALERCLLLTEFTRGYYLEVSDQGVVVHAARGEDVISLADASQKFTHLEEFPQILHAVQNGQPFFASQSPRTWYAIEQGQLPTFCVLPLMGTGYQLAALVFVREGPEVGVSAETTSLLIAVAERISHAFERSSYVLHLNQSREETLRALGLVLEYRDYETKGHTDRVLLWSERLGAALGLAGDDHDALRWGALLHDTGKVAIPDGILLKPGKLTPDEFDVIKRHPAIGFEMLMHIPSLPQATLDVVLYHQERWNGSGYPSGRAQQDIPLVARLFAVVDVYDALTSKRPYKPAWTHEEAEAQLRREAGILLDPEMVEVFLKLFEQETSLPQAAQSVSPGRLLL